MNMSENEWLFLKTIEELSSKLDCKEEYETLSIARILRLLLVDGNCLVNQINATYRLKLGFKVAKEDEFSAGLSKPNIASVTFGYDPECARPGQPVVELNRDQFLSFEVCSSQSKTFSIIDIIKIESHVRGAVHKGRVKSGHEDELYKLSEAFYDNRYHRFTLPQLRIIGRIVERSLRPLVVAVREDKKSDFLQLD